MQLPLMRLANFHRLIQTSLINNGKQANLLDFIHVISPKDENLLQNTKFIHAISSVSSSFRCNQA